MIRGQRCLRLHGIGLALGVVHSRKRSICEDGQLDFLRRDALKELANGECSLGEFVTVNAVSLANSREASQVNSGELGFFCLVQIGGQILEVVEVSKGGTGFVYRDVYVPCTIKVSGDD